MAKGVRRTTTEGFIIYQRGDYGAELIVILYVVACCSRPSAWMEGLRANALERENFGTLLSLSLARRWQSQELGKECKEYYNCTALVHVK